MSGLELGTNSPTPLTITGSLTAGDLNQGAQALINNTNSTVGKKYLRVDASGGLGILNNAYSASLLYLTDADALSATSITNTPIGAAPSTGAFTTLSASGVATLSSGSLIASVGSGNRNPGHQLWTDSAFGLEFQSDGTSSPYVTALYTRVTDGTIKFGSHPGASSLHSAFLAWGKFQAGGNLLLNYGESFGAQVGSSNTDLSKHVALYSTTYGFNITSGSLNYTVPSGGGHYLNVAGTNVLSLTAGEAAVTGTLSVSSTVSGAGFTSLLAPYEQTANKGAASGYAPLDSTSRVPFANLPAALGEALSFAGTWNASTNSPTLTSGSGVNGALYTVTTAGTTSLDGNASWGVGDKAVFNGLTSTWQKIDGQAVEVISVAGRNGAVTLTHSDLTDWSSATSGFTYTLPAATASVLGGVKPDGVTLANTSGAISVTYGTAANTAAQGNDSRITGALSATTAASTYAPLGSPTFSGAVTLASGDLNGTHSLSGGTAQLSQSNVNTTANTAARTVLQTGTANSYAIFQVTENGSGANRVDISCGAAATQGLFISSGTTGSPIYFYQGGSLRAYIDGSGNTNVSNNLAVTGSTALAAATASTPAVGTNSTAVATTAYVQGQASAATPLINGTASAGSSTAWSRGDHVHPTATTGATMIVASSAPSSPQNGALWWDTNDGRLYLYAATAWCDVSAIPPAFLATLDGCVIGGTTPASGAFTTLSASGTVSGAGITSLLAPYAPLASAALTGTPTAPTATAGTSTTQIATTAFVQGQAVVVNAAANQGRNKLMNGRYAVTQRGSGPWTISAWTADRWNFQVTGDTVSASIANLSDADRTAIGDEYAYNCFQCAVTGSSTAANATQLIQNIEDVRLLSGKTVTLSFYAKTSVALNLGVRPYQLFGSGGSPSAQVVLAATTFALTTSWARYFVTFTLGSTSGKTLGTNNDSCTGLAFEMSSGTTNASAFGVGAQTGTFSLFGMQLEIGPAATSLEARPYGVELALCQRFYQVGFLAGESYQLSGSTFLIASNLPVPMRATPTAAISSSTNSNLGTATIASNGGTTVEISGVASSSAQTNIICNYTLSADP